LLFIYPLSVASQMLNHLSSYQTNIEGSVETVTYNANEKRAYFTNSSTNSFSIVDVSAPASPRLVNTIDLTPYGGGPNSIASNGTVLAVAVEATIKQDAGKVVFFNLEGVFIKEVTAGALPDMLTFTPNGLKVLVANEGQPSNDYLNDPEGSITIIDISNGVDLATTTQLNFNNYDDKKASYQSLCKLSRE